ncbi:uncharacterized protein LOC111877974 [Lactuca sativa]|uniref:uncharacterized protein LOC111877974 n=1 Tax=Lactuca sativa TaxID=4236 RepID=UPI000CD8D8A7|nr:uncharacterized protein LOC111877974 [Lactuca sativa]
MKFMEASEKRHEATDAAINEQRTLVKNHHALMVEQQALIKNQQASINNLEVQLGQLATLVHEKLSPKNPETKTQSHVMAIDTEEDTISKFLEALGEEPQQPDPKPKKPKFESEEVVETPTLRRGTCLATTWPLSEQKVPEPVPVYQPPLPFPSRAHLSPLEREHLEFIQQIKGIPINTTFIETLAKIPEYAKFLQDLLATRKQLKKHSNVILSEQNSKAILGEIPKKMGDPGRLTLPCEFDFVVLDMKEDPNVPIILGRPLLNTDGALADIRKSKLTLRVGDEKEIFGIEDGFQRNHVQEEVFTINEDNELE